MTRQPMRVSSGRELTGGQRQGHVRLEKTEGWKEATEECVCVCVCVRRLDLLVWLNFSLLILSNVVKRWNI